MSELLSCPFCGGEADFGTANNQHGFGDLHYVVCMDIPCHAEGPYCKTHEEAIAAWNRRSLPTAEQAVVETAMALTMTAHEMGVVDPVSHIAVGMDLRKYAAKEHAVFDACAALAKLRQGEGE